MSQSDQYAVFGNPIRHSKSPEIHAAFAAQSKQDMIYRTHLVEEGKFAESAHRFFDNGGKGLNITVPCKVDAFRFADTLSDRARRAGAVNTLAKQDDGTIYGDNTDGAGIVRDMLENLAWDVTDRRVLILGAGGAVRGILSPLLARSPSHIVIANRTVKKAQDLAREFSELGEVRGCRYEGLAGSQFDLVINGTSASMAGELPPLPAELLSETACCYDMMYSADPTPFMRWAAGDAAWAVSDGLGMLVEQAAESFCIWRGIRPNTGPVIEQIRASLNKSTD
ncbi:shikimate dehydrogenase [Litorivivens sp.]|uniref:shikimate dehydrogenase n=1 Tax=Litorivivens sp. TaxID=2020868 RepID=UPI0035650CC0